MRAPARLWSAALFLLLLGRAAPVLPQIQASCPKFGKRLSRERTNACRQELNACRGLRS